MEFDPGFYGNGGLKILGYTPTQGFHVPHVIGKESIGELDPNN